MKGQDRLSVMTIVMHSMHHTSIRDANEDCAIKARQIRVHSGVFFNKDCVVEAGYHEARDRCIDYADFFIDSV